MGYKVDNIVAQAQGLKEADVKVFAPVIQGEVMSQFQEILVRLEQSGWFLTHWAVIPDGVWEKGFPVFRYQG